MRDPSFADAPPSPDYDHARKDEREEAGRLASQVRDARRLMPRNCWSKCDARQEKIAWLMEFGPFSWLEARDVLDAIDRDPVVYVELPDIPAHSRWMAHYASYDGSDDSAHPYALGATREEAERKLLWRDGE